MTVGSGGTLGITASSTMTLTAPTATFAGCTAAGGLVIPITQPSNPVDGSMYFKTSDHKLYVYYGASWWLI